MKQPKWKIRRSYHAIVSLSLDGFLMRLLPIRTQV